MADKRLSLDDLVGELRSGMAIGIGGWGSRRKPMAAVRAILPSDLTDLTVVSYGGPDVGLLCAAGKVAKVVFGFVTLDSIPTEPPSRWPARRPPSSAVRSTRACSTWGCSLRRNGFLSFPPGPDWGQTCWLSIRGCAW